MACGDAEFVRPPDEYVQHTDLRTDNARFDVRGGRVVATARYVQQTAFDDRCAASTWRTRKVKGSRASSRAQARARNSAAGESTSVRLARLLELLRTQHHVCGHIHDLVDRGVVL